MKRTATKKEEVFHLLIFQAVSPDFFYILLFSAMLGCVAGGILDLLPERVSRFVSALLILAVCILFCTEAVYHSVFQSFLVLSGTADLAGQAMDFTDVIWKNIFGNLLTIILLLLPFPLFYVCRSMRWIDFSRKSLRTCGISLGVAAECYLTATLFLNLSGAAPYSSHDIYYHNVSADMTVEHFGVMTMNRLDGLYAMVGRPSRTLQIDSETTDPGNEIPVYMNLNACSAISAALSEMDISNMGMLTPNTMNIDFAAMAASAPNENTAQLTRYFQSQKGTLRNQYTGMFKGYNVIFITAEGFYGRVIDQNLTPTLYRLRNEGFVFNHYYTPGWYASTSDGEYSNLTGLLPTDGLVSLKMTGKTEIICISPWDGSWNASAIP